MNYKVTMVRDGLFQAFTRRKVSKIEGNNFLVSLDDTQARHFRKEAQREGKDANKYLSEILNKLGR
tara:strand:+ start:275 stop:472 length:198 start_codon:yes stop_codon:yes gene_type:complete